MEDSSDAELGSHWEEDLGMGIHLYAIPQVSPPGPYERQTHQVGTFLAIAGWIFSHLSKVSPGDTAPVVD